MSKPHKKNPPKKKQKKRAPRPSPKLRRRSNLRARRNPSMPPFLLDALRNSPLFTPPFTPLPPNLQPSDLTPEQEYEQHIQQSEISAGHREHHAQDQVFVTEPDALVNLVTTGLRIVLERITK